MNERAAIAGPYHGTRADGSIVRARAIRLSRLGPPGGEQLARRDRPARRDRRIGAAAGEQHLGVGGERVRIGQRQRGTLVEEPQVADLIAHHPTRRRRRRVPRGVVQRSDDPIEVGVLGGQVVADRVHAVQHDACGGPRRSRAGRAEESPRGLSSVDEPAVATWRSSWQAPSSPPEPSWLPAPSWPPARPSSPVAAFFAAGAFLAGAAFFAAGAFLAAAAFLAAGAFLAGAAFFAAGAFLAGAAFFAAGAFLAGAAFFATATVIPPPTSSSRLSWPALLPSSPGRPSWR